MEQDGDFKNNTVNAAEEGGNNGLDYCLESRKNQSQVQSQIVPLKDQALMGKSSSESQPQYSADQSDVPQISLLNKFAPAPKHQPIAVVVEEEVSQGQSGSNSAVSKSLINKVDSLQQIELNDIQVQPKKDEKEDDQGDNLSEVISFGSMEEGSFTKPIVYKEKIS